MKLDYISYWNSKGEYGKERVRRMLERKKKRKENPIKSHQCENCKSVFPHPIAYINDPFDEEMFEIINPRRLCNDCYNSLLGDI